MNPKDMLFKYSDKMVFALFLVLLAFSAYRLLYTPPEPVDTAVRTPQRPLAAGADVLIPREAEALVNWIRMPFEDPAVLTASGIATDPDLIEPDPATEKLCPKCGRIVPKEIMRCPECNYNFPSKDDSDRDGLPDTWEMKYFGHLDYGPDDDPDGDGFTNIEEYRAGTDPTDPKSIPGIFSIYEIGTEPVDIYFQGFIINEGGKRDTPSDKWTIQINWGKNAETSLIPYGGYFRGYRVYPIEKKINKVWKPSLNVHVEEETWFLTIQKENRQPIIVEIKTEARENEPYVILSVTRGKDKGSRTKRLYDTETFTANNETFIVRGVTEEQVTVVREDGTEITLKRQ